MQFLKDWLLACFLVGPLFLAVIAIGFGIISLIALVPMWLKTTVAYLIFCGMVALCFGDSSDG